MTYSNVPGDDRCECFDTGDNHPINNSGRDGLQCTRKATSTLWRVDMEDNSGTRFCEECAMMRWNLDCLPIQSTKTKTYSKMDPLKSVPHAAPYPPMPGRM